MKNTASTVRRSFDPVISEESYRVDLVRFQNHHNTNTDSKTVRLWALDYIKRKDASLVSTLESASDYELRTIGLIARAISQDYYISLNHVIRIDEEIQTLFKKYNHKNKVVQQELKKENSVEDRNIAAARKHAAEVQGAIDAFVESGTNFVMRDYLAMHNINGVVAKLIAEKFIALEQELEEASQGTDEQLTEAYSFMSKVKLRKFHNLVEEIIQDCDQQVVTAKIRKPRTTKKKPASVLVSKMKYQRECTDLKLKSENPTSIVGASMVWLFDTEKRKASVYVAEPGQTLGVRGTTITGFSVKDSAVKMVRKPQEFLSHGFAKKTIMNNFKALSTKPSAPHGRTSDSTIILKVY